MIKTTNECWEWTACRSTAGYGKISVKGKSIYAHRLSYELFVGAIPDNLQIDHLCRNRACINPHHLEAVTHRENVLRGEALSAYAAKQTHCVHGHEFNKKNTYLNKLGHRLCRPCHAIWAREFRLRRKHNEKLPS